MQSGENVLVTGAAGFIGSHLTHQLVTAGAKVRAYIRYNSNNTSGFIEDLPKYIQGEIEIVKGDLRDPHAVYQAVKGMNTVYHLGALIAIPYSYLHPTDVVQTNVLGTLNVAQAARDLNVDRIIHTSTSEVYGSAQYVPMDESHILQGQSPYSASKIAADKIIESFYCSYALPIVTVRPFNAYGPRQSMRAVIPTIINQALFRPEIVLGNLTATRDFTYVEDTARAFRCAASQDNAIGQVINAGSGSEVSIGDLAAQINNLVGRHVPVRVSHERKRPEKSEVNRLFSDSRKAFTMMGWQPVVSLEQGLASTIEWIKHHPELYHPSEYVV